MFRIVITGRYRTKLEVLLHELLNFDSSILKESYICLSLLSKILIYYNYPETMNSESKLEKYADIDIFVANQRGNFIHLMIIVESILEDIIKHHYCKEAVRDEFVFSVLTKENFSFNMKYQLVCFILKNHFGDFYKVNSDLLKELDVLIIDRNHFAHRKFFSANPENDVNKEGKYSLEHYKTENHKTVIKPIEFTLDSYQKKLKQISSITHKLLEVYSLLGVKDSDIVKYHDKD
jgi:hypothetical protein